MTTQPLDILFSDKDGLYKWVSLATLEGHSFIKQYVLRFNRVI